MVRGAHTLGSLWEQSSSAASDWPDPSTPQSENRNNAKTNKEGKEKLFPVALKVRWNVCDILSHSIFQCQQ